MAFTCSKKISFAAAALFVIIALFTSCDSFLESKTVKQEIEQHIAYANAPSYKILVQANDEDGTLKKPITGELTQKVTDTFEIKFAPAQDHEFVRWEASSVELPEGESIYDYISFEDAASPETKVTFKKALNSIVITAFCPSLPYVTFLLTGSRYGKFSPVKGTYTCVQTHSYPLSFDPDTDYEFVRWQIYDSKTGTEIPNGTYLKIEDPSESSTTYSLAAVPVNSEISLAIKPVIAERPQILSRSPVDNGNSFYKDSRIQVLFDHEMDESSIYYTKEELDDLKADGTADSGLFEDERNGKPVYFGYEKDGITYFKNILIKNYEKPTEILNECFEHPRFETPTLLIIASNCSTEAPEIPNFAIVHVSLEKDLSYKVEEKSVNMPKSERWIYQVKSTKDIDPPILTAPPLEDSSGNTLTSSDNTPSEPWTMNNYTNRVLSLALDFSLNDTGSGPANQFAIETKRVCDGDCHAVNDSTETIYLNFQEISANTATYTGTYTLPKIKQYGVYSLRFVFYDKANKETYFPETGYYYYYYDKESPSLQNITAVTSENSLNISWEPDANDYQKTIVYYRKMGESSWLFTETTTNKINISGFPTGIWYEYYLEPYDQVGNYGNDQWHAFSDLSTKPSSYDNDGNITLSWDPPTGGSCYYYNVTYTYNGNTITQKVLNPTLTFPAAETSSIETIPVLIQPITTSLSIPYSYNVYSSFDPVVTKSQKHDGGAASGGEISIIQTTYYYIKIQSPENSQGFTYSIRQSDSTSNSSTYHSTNLNFDQDILVKENSTYKKLYFKVRAEKDGKEVWSKLINVYDYWPYH